MKAAVLVAPHRFEIQERPVPAFGPDDVLVQVERVGICGTDLHIFHGHYAAERLPLVPGHELVGRVADMGRNVRGLRHGRRVVLDINIGCGTCYWCRRNEILSCPDMAQIGITRDGAFAEFLVAPARLAIPVPDDGDVGVLALTEPVACVIRAAKKARVRVGQSVVILGAGPIGNLHVQLMRLLGAAPIIVADLSEERCRMARDAGADVTVPDANALHAAVMAHTGGRGADLVIESVGNAKLYQDTFRLIRKGGHVAFFGITGPEAEVPVNILNTILQENSLKGSVAGMGEDMHDAVTLLTHGRFKTDAFTQAIYPLERIQHAFETLSKRPQQLKTQIGLS
jgi:2-desacetyl-2-hydroxyethyl bacteriochlorophyllide A dehydrogenase